MRASRKPFGKRPEKGAAAGDVHVSGAEGICAEEEAMSVAGSYLMRAMRHPRGNPDRIVITLERLKERPLLVSALPVATIERHPRGARMAMTRLLSAAGVSDSALRKAFEILFDGEVMRGAAVLRALSGERIEADHLRGVRVSRIGMTRRGRKSVSAALGRHGINTDIVREALTLASKVAACPGIVAEVCASDDPDYTTGYVASPGLGYVRIPGVKRKGSARGGRVFFLSESADIDDSLCFLESTPVMIDAASGCTGTLTVDEILRRAHR